MTGYSRQSSIVDGEDALASLWNDEYNQLEGAFNRTTGHKHDGTTTEGPVIALIGDAGLTTPLNKVVVNTANDRVSVYNDVAGTSVEQVRFEDGVIKPVTDSDVDLGTNALRFRNAYIDSITCPTLASTFISAVEASDAASVSFTDIDTTYSEYLLILSNVRHSYVSNDALFLTTSTNNGSSWQADLSSCLSQVGQVLGGLSHIYDNSYIRLANTIGSGDSSNQGTYSGTVHIFNPANPATQTNIMHSGIAIYSNNTPIANSGVGSRAANEAVNAIKIWFYSGNILSGSFRLYGLRKS